MSDMKVHIAPRNRYYYPDVVVSCDPRDRETPISLRFPSVIVEILSDSTEAFDRGDKFQDYQTIESLQEYVLISAKQHLAQCFRRNGEGLWVLQSYTGNIFGVVLADAIKNVGWRGRNAELIAKVEPAVIIEVQEKIRTLVL